MIFDLHNDILTAPLSFKQKSRILSEYAKTERGIIAVFWSSKSKTLPRLKSLITTNKKIKFALEDAHILNSENISRFLSYKPIYCGLTWNGDNQYAGGAYGQGALTSGGIELIKIFNKRGVITDSAHLNKKSFYGIIDFADRVINSHCALNSVCDHPRNLDDAQIKMIVEKGGLVGLCPVSQFLTGGKGAKAADFFRHIDTFIQKFGIKNVGIGTDIFGSDDIAEGLNSYGGYILLKETMLRHGYTEEDTDSVFYKNALSFLG